MKTPLVTIVVPFYRNAQMLRVHLEFWLKYYDAELRNKAQLVIVDDGSPQPALAVVREEYREAGIPSWLQLYRIQKDIPWNRNGARNLGAHVAMTDWLLHMDIDHILPADSFRALMNALPTLSPKQWYRFRRFRRGCADETRKKDKIGSDVPYGEIKPHGDSYLCTRAHYWKAGGYNEDFSGCLGGGSPFQRELEKVAPAALAPASVFLEVYTRSVCADASDFALSRDTSEYTRRRKALERAGRIKGHDPLRFPWVREL